MAKSAAVWGIDVGQCALKALRCRAHEKPDRIVADAFDYIEYPQILSEPGADATELTREALKTFLSRNTVRGDKVAISVPGQAGLSRFIKLPPVEASKIPDIVRYEARQQIPFGLDEVVWDFQRMGGGAEEEGFALETEIGLFAMKREQVWQSLSPFVDAKVDVDIVQLAPVSLYNYLLFDQLHDMPSLDDVEDRSTLPWVVILSLGTESSDLVLSNGLRIWQRSIPVGGNQFTKALSKELRLAFPKAEHLKRNATSAQDPKAVFQAMRPVFNDLLTEVQRSLSYFSSIERTASISRMVAVGNAVKLPGLRKYLEQNLGLEVSRVETFRGLVGSAVVAAPAFQENAGAFATCYGLAVQGLEKSGLRTNLLPIEVVHERIIRAKKPWAVAAAALLLLGISVSFGSAALAVKTVRQPEYFDPAERQVKQVSTNAASFKSEAEQARNQFSATDKIGSNLVANVEGRVLWAELLAALNQCLPRDAELKAGEEPKPVELRNQLHITGVECQWTDNLATWFEGKRKWYQPGPGEKMPAAGTDASAAGGANPPAEGAPSPDAPTGFGPQGPGWILSLKGVHYHNGENEQVNYGAQFVRNTLISAIQNPSFKVKLPQSGGTGIEMASMKDLGVAFPVLVEPGSIEKAFVFNPYAETLPANATAADRAAAEARNKVPVRVFRFDVQLAWQPTPPAKRIAKKTEQTKAPGEQ